MIEEKRSLVKYWRIYIMMHSVSNAISSFSKGKRHDLRVRIDKKCCRGQSYRRNRHTLTEFSVPELPATKFLLQFAQ